MIFPIFFFIFAQKSNFNNMTPLGKYIWLIKLLQERDGMTFEEINKKWLESRKNKEDKNIPILKRTFHNHINAIREEYGIHIECGPGYRYYIADPDKDVLPKVERLSMLNMMSETVSNSKLSNSLFIEEYFDIFRGNAVLTIMDAIKAKRKVKLENFVFPHKPEDKYRVLNVAPYQLHYICSKWFLIGQTDEYGLMRIPLSYYYGTIQITGDSYKYPAGYSSDEYRKAIYGKTNDRLLLTIQIQNRHPERMNIDKYPLPFQQDTEYGYKDKEGKTFPFLDKFHVRINFDLPKTPLALYVLKRKIEKYSYTILSNKDPFALYTDEQYEEALNNPVVLLFPD